MDVSRSKLIWSVFWNFMERCSVQIVNFVVTIVLARMLLPEEYGIIAMITIFIALANTISDGGFNSALIQKKDVDNVDFSTVFYGSLSISVCMYMIIYVSAPTIAMFFENHALIKVLRVISISLFFYAMSSVQRAYVLKKMQFKKLFYCNLISALFSGVLGILMAYEGYGVWALVAQSISLTVFTVLCMWFIIKWRPQLLFSFTKFKLLFDFGWKIFLSNLLVTLFTRIRALLIGKYYQPATLAYYDKGHSFPSLISNNVCGAVQAVLFPAFSEVQNDRIRLKAIMRRAINTNCLIMFPMMIGLIVCAKPLVLLLLTEKWLPAVPFLQVLCVAHFFRPITIPNIQAIMAMGYSNVTLKLEIIRKIVDVAFLLITIQLGALVIAVGVVIFNFLCIFINLIPNVRFLDYKIKEQFSDIIPLFIISIIMGASIYWINNLDVLHIYQIMLAVAIGVPVYVILLYFFKVECFMYLLDSILIRIKRK